MKKEYGKCLSLASLKETVTTNTDKMAVSLGVKMLEALAPGFDDIIAICPFSIVKNCLVLRL